VTGARLLHDLRARGVRVEASGPDGIRLLVPPGALGPQQLEQLRPRKADLLDALRAEALAIKAGDLAEAPVVEARSEVGAVLVRSERYGEAWIVLDARLDGELLAEEAARPEPRPVLALGDVLKLKGKPEATIRAVLAMSRVFTGARLVG
jgi:hypothetical protein